ncbi:hypothetical protein AB0425_40995 [Actinosynnema sp. NPDC051121]
MTGERVGRGAEKRRRVDKAKVSRTGDAIASAPGAIAISGVGTVHLAGAPSARSYYREQIVEIAATPLVGRDEELAELHAFCTAPEDDAPTYRWWRAPKWSGKTLLLANFALRPPPGVRVVAFFVTARWAGHDTRAAFVDIVGDQLAEILGEPSPTTLPRHVSDSYLNGLLTRAATTCRERGERLVLLVDGLDEDRGTPHDLPGRGTSIAAALPARPPAGMRIVVSGRPTPQLPADVPTDHPLRDPAVVRPLERSPHAEVAEHRMLLELDRLLHAGSDERDLLGLLTTARGGLTAADLAELTGRRAVDVRRLLRGVTARTFDTRTGRWRRDTLVYLLGHEDLHDVATEELGESLLDEYRQRLHAWAERYRDLRWPHDTPEYLLRGYYAMLKVDGLTSHMLTCATDPHRRDRMLDLSGGDAAALGEIAAARDAVAAADEPDLLALLRLDIHREHVEERNSAIPAELPTAWARLGQLNRAEAMSRAITCGAERAKALASLAGVALRRGDRDRATRLLRDAETAASTVSEPADQGWTLWSIVTVLIDAGRPADAEALARRVFDPKIRTYALSSVACAVHDAGEPGRAADLLRSIEQAVDRSDPSEEVLALLAIAEALAHAEQPGRASEVLDRAERMCSSDDWYLDEWVPDQVVRCAIRMGDVDRALRRVESASASMRDDMLSAAVEEARTVEDLDRFARLVDALVDDGRGVRATAAFAVRAHRAGDAKRSSDLLAVAERTAVSGGTPHLLVHVAAAAAAVGDVDRALALAPTTASSEAELLITAATALIGTDREHAAPELLHRAQRAARDPFAPVHRAFELLAVANAALDVGDPAATSLLDRADIAIAATADNLKRDQLLVSLAEAMARSGRVERADEITDSTHVSTRIRALASLSAIAADRGDRQRAEVLLDRGIAVGATDDDARRAVAEAAARLGRFDYAMATIEAVTDRSARARAFLSCARSAARSGHRTRASELLDLGLRAAGTSEFPWLHAQAPADGAVVAHAMGDPDRARALLDQAELIARSDNGTGDQAITSVVLAAATTGDFARATAVARSITDPVLLPRVLVSLTADPDLRLRRKAIVRALEKAPWSQVIGPLAELHPEAISVVKRELDSLTLIDERT